MNIGIPKALHYYNYYPLWESFFEGMGHRIILSGHTTKSILNKGVGACVDDACLPIKLFHGHVLDLIGKSDVVFLPRMVSIEPGEFTCPKFIGLPEMIKSSIKDFKDWLVLDFNAYRSKKNGHKGYLSMAMEISKDSRQITRNLDKAYKCQEHFEELLKQGNSPLDLLEEDRQSFIASNNKGTIGLIGHPYLIFDTYASMDLLRKLREQGYRVITPENIPMIDIERECSRMPKKLFWSYAKTLLGGGLSMMKYGVDGIIYLSSFGCGIDAFIEDLLRRINEREYKIPYTIIVIDEHSGQAGFDTRVEAFLDMMQWRRDNGNYFSSYGKGIHSN